MATVRKGPAPGHWTIHTGKSATSCVEVSPDLQQVKKDDSVQCRNFNEHLLKEKQSLEAIPPDQLWTTQVADGYAYYYVKTEKPLTLLLIPFADGYQANPILIRGLRIQDVREQQQRQVRFREMMAQHQRPTVD